MSSQYTLKMSPEQAKEMPMVDLAFAVLKAANTPFYYRDLMMEIAKIKGLSEDGMMNVIAQLYTEINIDGRFACVGSNLWGLKRWYPVEKTEDAVGNVKRPRIINDDDDDDLDEADIFPEEADDEVYEAEDEDFDAFDEDREDLEDEEEFEEELDESDEEEVVEDSDLDEESSEDADEEADDFEDEEEDEEEDK